MSLGEKLSTRFWLCPALLLALGGTALPAYGKRVNGRITFGGYAANENFSDEDSGSTRNDFLTTSGRLFLEASELGERENWSTTLDLRDKHDFFDKLDRERLQLTDHNTFQVRQMSGRYGREGRRGFFEFGRFPLIDAGNVQCDGAAVGFMPNSAVTMTAFGGLNPKRPDQQYMTFNSNAQHYGGIVQYQNLRGGWSKNLFASAALVEQRVEGQVDRRYLFSSSSVQWSPQSRLIHLLYLDFVPRTYVQTGYLDLNLGITRALEAQVRGLAVDVIEYSRRQGLRERLAPSPYREGTVGLSLLSAKNIRGVLDLTYGKRSDQLDKRELRIKLQMPRLISPKWDASLSLINRDNFISKDTLGRGGLGYFSRRYELSVEAESGLEKYNDGTNRHPLTVEFSGGYYMSRALFTALSYERAQDEKVKINSVFLKVSYRFGNEEIAPLRNGAAPRGRL